MGAQKTLGWPSIKWFWQVSRPRLKLFFKKKLSWLFHNHYRQESKVANAWPNSEIFLDDQILEDNPAQDNYYKKKSLKKSFFRCIGYLCKSLSILNKRPKHQNVTQELPNFDLWLHHRINRSQIANLSENLWSP